MVGSLVVGGEAGVFYALQVAVVDAAHVAGHVRDQRVQGILAEQARLDVDAGEAVAVHREPRHLFVGQARADRQAVRALGLYHQALEAGAVARADFDHAFQVVDGLLQVGDLARGYFQGIRGVIARQHGTAAVEYESAVGHDGHNGDAVVLGLGAVVVVLHDLQVDETQQQQRERGEHECTGNADAHVKMMQLALVVLEFCETHASG